VRFKAKVWRHIPVGAYALHVGRILRADGRWNRPWDYGCLYTALSQKGARAEFEKIRVAFGAAPEDPKHRELVSLIVDLDPVVDLTNINTSPVPPDAAFLTGDLPKDIEQCRDLADALRAAGYVGIIAPSAADPGEKNLAIYIDGPASGIYLEDGGERILID